MALTPTSESSPKMQAWRRLALVFGLSIAVAVLYWPSARALNALWTNPEGEEAFSHGYLILLISLWLIVRDRKRLVAAPVEPLPVALIPLVFLSAAWAFAWRASIQELHLVLLPLILLTASLAALGRRSARILAFPILYLYFAMPIWSDINGFVQTLSAKMTGVLIWITGLPAFMQGDYVQLPAGTIEIAESCSGLHALIVGLALATLYAKLAEVSLRRRLIWIGVMGALALIVNWLRIFTVTVAAYATDMQSSLVRSHYWLGWWLFAGAFAIFLWLTQRGPVTDQSEPAAEDASKDLSSTGRYQARLASTAMTIAVLAALPLLAYSVDWARSGSDGAPIEIAWPRAPQGWNGPTSGDSSEWAPKFRNPDGESLQRYTDADGHSVDAFAVAYRVQTQAAKLLSFWNHLLAGPGGLRSVSERIVDSPAGRWRETRVIDSAGTSSLVWSRYRIGSRLFVEPRLSQLWYGLVALVNPPLSSLTALRTDCARDCTAAAARLAYAASRVRPPLK